MKQYSIVVRYTSFSIENSSYYDWKLCYKEEVCVNEDGYITDGTLPLGRRWSEKQLT